WSNTGEGTANRPPTATSTPFNGGTFPVGSIADYKEAGQGALGVFFADADSDTLTYTAAAQHPALLGVSLTGDAGEAHLQVTLLNQGSSKVTYTASDAYGGQVTRTTTIGITAKRSRRIAENSPAGTLVGDPVTGTPYNGEALSYSLTGNAASSGLFVINSSTGQISVAQGATLDYETDDSYRETETWQGEVVKFYRGKVEYTVDSIAAEIDVSIIVTDVEAEQPAIALSVSPEYIQEGQNAAKVTVTATRDGTTGDHSVTLSVGGGTATGGTDYTIWSLSEVLRIQPGESTASVTLTFTVVADGIDEGNESVILSGTAGGATVSDAVVTIGEPENIALSVAPSTIAEDAGATQVTVTATLDKARDTATAVTLSLAGTAADPADYAATSPLPSITIPKGQTSADATFTVTPVDDALVEGDETIVVNGQSGSRPVSSATTTITDNDGPSIALSVSPEYIQEGQNQAKVTVTATRDSTTGDHSVTLSVGGGTATGGTDYTIWSLSEVLRIQPGESTASVTLTFTVVADGIDEGNESVILSGTAGGATVSDAVVTIGEPENIALSVAPSTIAEDAGATQVTVTATLDKARDTATAVTLSLAGTAADPADYAATSPLPSITIPKGQTSADATLTVTPVDDALVEGDETIVVNGQSGSRSVSPATITVADNAAGPAVTIADSSAAEGDSIIFTVTLSAAVSGGLTVTPSFTAGTAASTDYTANTAALSFTGMEGEQKTFTVVTTEDEVVEADETFTVSLAVSGTSETITATDTANGTISNDDSAAVTIDDAVAVEGETLTFTVTLDNAVQDGLKVTPSFTDVTATKGTDYTGDAAALTFAGSAAETQTFTVDTVADRDTEGAETFTVSLTLSAAPPAVTATDTATGTIADDGVVVVTIDDASAAEGDSLTFTVKLNQAVKDGLKVTPSFTDVTATKGTDYTENTAAL
ncbi:MAG: hypothetical protein F4X26_00005, partial [Chloroflexi bacterium]|nr:hypothetical protein [Chloroflexota bacterium]